MRDTIEMAGEVWQSGTGRYTGTASIGELKHFEALVRADEREQGQKWFDAVTEQHKAALLVERNASINAVLQVIKELRPALVLAAFADKDNAWVLDKVKESVEKLKEKT
jgi:hypothetical protein